MQRRDLLDEIGELQRRAADLERDHVPVTVYSAIPIRKCLGDLEDAGVEHAVLGLPPKPRDDVLAILDQHVNLLSSSERDGDR